MAALLVLLGAALAIGAMIPSSDYEDQAHADDTDGSGESVAEVGEEPISTSNDLFDGSEEKSDQVASTRTLDLFDKVLNGNTSHGAAQTDFLTGGEGDDLLIGGHSDVLEGGSGADAFQVASTNTVYLQDYDGSDEIWIEFDGEAPEITLDATDEGMSILANGFPVAMIREVYEFDMDKLILIQKS